MGKGYAHLCDAELVNLIRGDDGGAFTEIYQRYWQKTYNQAFKRSLDHDQALDIVQEIFCDLWARRTDSEIHHLASYLNQAIKFQVYNVLRKNRSTTRFFELFDRLAHSAAADVPTLEKELHAKLQAWLERLPEKKRTIFELHYDEGRNTSEIADAVKVSQKTVQNQLSLAKLDLKNKILSLVQILSTLALLSF